MCQLTFVHTSDEHIKKELLTFLLMLNTQEDHHDGVGMSYHIKPKDKRRKPDRFISQNLAIPFFNRGFYEGFINEEFMEGFPVVAHVRKATSSYYKAKNEKEEDETKLRINHVHPFMCSNNSIILAHNGTLRFQDTERESNTDEEFPDMIDSQIFLECLSEVYNKQKKKARSIPEALKETMKLFWGKFAFLIEETATNEYFVVRGKATLYKSELTLDGESIGFVVNTELKGLRTALGILQQAVKMYRNQDLKFSNPEGLEEETIYRLDKVENTLVKVDELEQNVKEYKAPKASSQPQSTYRMRQGVLIPPTATHANTTTPATEGGKLFEVGAKFLEKYMVEFGDISVYELDQIMTVFSGDGLISLTPKKLRDFALLFGNPAVNYLEETSTRKATKKRWRKIKTNTWLSRDARELYKRFPEINFPYFFTPPDILHQVELKTRKINREASGKEK